MRRFAPAFLLLSSVTGTQQHQEDAEPGCGYYLAPSAIPGAGLGVFTTKNIANEEKLLYDDIVLNFVDPSYQGFLHRKYAEQHLTKQQQRQQEDPHNSMDWIWKNYAHNGVNTMAEVEADEVASFSYSIAMVANTHSILHNVEMRQPPPLEAANRVVLERMEDVGAGAVSNYHGVHFVSTREIQAGEELLVPYTPGHMATEKPDFDPTPSFSGEKAGHKRTIEWLQEYGVCLDNLEPKVSENHTPQAGYGAFATKDIKDGQVIAPIPVLPIERSVLQMYKSLNQQHIWKKGHQLLLNYAYGHPESSMLLLPYGPTVSYLNHGGAECNAKLQWSKTLSNATMLQEWPANLLQLKEPGLVLEVVATRDIDKEEEVTIDYGTLWDTAWKEFTAEWNREARSLEYSSYISAAGLNQKKEFLRTDSELGEFPYPKNVRLMCFTSYVERSDGKKRFSEKPGMYNSTQFLRPCKVQARQFEETTEEGIYRNPLDLETYIKMENAGLEDEYVRYDMSVLVGGGTNDPKDEKTIEVLSFPRKAIQFVDRKYTSDLHRTKNAFRHEIQLPETIIPFKWLDLI